jgi:hypothetical protein
VTQLTKEQLEARQKQRAEDAEAAKQLLASPRGAALIRHLEVLWSIRGVAETPEKTAYRLGRRDAVEELKDIRQEGSHAA